MEQKKDIIENILQELEFQKPYVDVDEWREGSVRYHYIHGGFEGTEVRFSLYFPDEKDYLRRFFHFVAPVQGNEDASQQLKGIVDKIGFAIMNGAYFVESNMGGPEAKGETLYRSSAAVAEYSRLIAAKLYGQHRPYGYIYGGSGGGFKTMSCFENTNAWDGAVPYVIGSPMAIPSVFTVRAHALRVLRNKLPMIADAIEPGGSDDIYAGLNQEEKEALEEATKMGFPKRSWFLQESIGLGAFPIFVPMMEQVDPEYFTDFWMKPGYLGADPNGSAVRDRIQHKTVITETHLVNFKNREEKTGVDDAWQRLQAMDTSNVQPWMKLESVPEGDVYLTGAKIVILSGDAAGFKLPLDKLEGDKAFVGVGYEKENMIEILEKVKPGDEIMLDNSNFIAVQTYHRHQVPSSDYKVWDQFRNGDGEPLYPQRPFLIGPMITRGGSGSLQSGRFNGKMIVVATLLDHDAYPWQPDWYRSKVRENLGEKESEHFRIWYIDHAPHGDYEKTLDDLHLVGYLGALHQALLDLSDWVERGVAPVESSKYMVEDGQVSIPPKANERKGIQPTVELMANGEKSIVVAAGEPVHFTAEIEVISNDGQLTKVEWNFEGESEDYIEGEFTNMIYDGSVLSTKAEHTFSRPGTYFPVLRVQSNRHGDAKNIFTQIQNIGRVRVIVNSTSGKE
ncbi:hypothetical protein CR203_20120 [Salipaludibacillus neizhouensis]|uniref:PKD domain-containing protein n=1 Tax=Salipaludibacillus neizhouensis TaxID=885475 RepID=A0A3A9K2P9_9BACI|nr:hypothetical protein [Salipaludibacillus neizhouensis]RKL65508.1 hypothetical protein CR203_20120 [Salipaludibacillus neizhouensis]